jgi:uncharacterized protein with HEPN domain
MPHSSRKLLLDIIFSCEETMGFTKGKNYVEFQEDRMLQLAIEREFEIIGEALYRLEKIEPMKLLDKIPEYGKIVGFRNIIAHGYDIIDEAAMWDFVKNRVPELLEKAQNY